MTNYEYHQISQPSEKALDTIESIFDELKIPEIERRTFKNLFIALLRKERTEAALEFYEQCKYNK